MQNKKIINNWLASIFAGLVFFAAADSALGQAAKWILSGKSDRSRK